MTYIATVASAQDLLNTLTSATNGGKGYLDDLWQLFLYKGQLYEIVSKSAAVFAVIPIAFWVINHFRNMQSKLDDPKLDTGDVIRYLIMGALLFGLFNPSATSQGLYDAKVLAFSTASDINQAAVKIANDPVTLMASVSAAERSYGEGLALCNKEPDPTKRQTCIDNAKLNAGANKLLTVGQKFLTDGWLGALTEIVPDPFQVFVQSMLLIFGFVFLLLLEVAQLLCSLFFPWILLISIADYGVLWGWLKTWVTVALVHTAYNLCVISISFAMAKSNTPDTLVWAVVVGLGAPWLSIEIVTGNRFGILQNMSAVASKVINAGR